MRIQHLGLMPYREAWAVQEAVHAEVVAGGPEAILLVEHPPVVTFGRRPGVERNLIASDDQLARLGIEVVKSDRGGDVTFHGPGQIVAYPIVRLIDHRLSVGGYVKALENSVITALKQYGIESQLDPTAVGVWVDESPWIAPAQSTGPATLAKICALGVRIRRGVSLHGLALNVTTDLRYFNLIVPCGLVGRPVTSMQRLLVDRCPPIDHVETTLTNSIITSLSQTA